MRERSQFIGRLAVATQIVFAILLGGVASLSFDPSPVSRGTVILVVFSLPALVGLIGTTARRPGLLAAAALTSGIGAFIAFSGVTLIFVVPAVMFVYAALAVAAAPQEAARGGWFARVAQVAIAGAIAVLIVGAGASGLLITDSGCWTATHTPTGVRFETLPYSGGEITLSGVGDFGGCSTGLISLRGVALGALLGSSAIGLALAAARRRDRPIDTAARTPV